MTINEKVVVLQSWISDLDEFALDELLKEYLDYSEEMLLED
jgi:hypothetical protein